MWAWWIWKNYIFVFLCDSEFQRICCWIYYWYVENNIIGFNYEVLKEKDDNIGFWDVGGKTTVITLNILRLEVYGVVFTKI